MNSEQLVIKKAGLSDLEELKQIGKLVFRETFAEFNTEEDMKTYLEESFSNEKLSEELQNLKSEFYFALVRQAHHDSQTEVVGYLKVNFGEAQSDLHESDSMEIERIYVSKAYHGKNVGQALYQKAIEIAKAHQSKSVWLGVWEKNERAIAFYQKNGFVAFDTHVFVLGTDHQTDVLMRYEL